MKNLAVNLAISVLALGFGVVASSVWQPRNDTSVELAKRSQDPQPTTKPVAKPRLFEEFTDQPTLSYAGYEVSKRDKKVKVEQSNAPAEVTYAVVKKNGKVLGRFEGFEQNYHPLGSQTSFGLFAFLGGPSKQLIIEQTQWRQSTHFIVDLSPVYAVVFESGKWGVGRELMYEDVDGDGVFEISQAVMAFIFFENLTNASSHLVDITFKYDAKTQQYTPANQVFQQRSLDGIESQIENLNRHDERQFASDVLHILLKYIYAGKAAEAWSFYDREYNLGNKKELKEKIKVKLKNEPVYRFIYPQS